MSEVKLTIKEQKLLAALLNTDSMGVYSKSPNEICKEVGVGAAYGTLLIKNGFLLKVEDQYVYNDDKPHPNIHMIKKLTDEVQRYGREANQRHAQKKKREAYEAEIAEYKGNLIQCIGELPQEFSYIKDNIGIRILDMTENRRMPKVDINFPNLCSEIPLLDPAGIIGPASFGKSGADIHLLLENGATIEIPSENSFKNADFKKEIKVNDPTENVKIIEIEYSQEPIKNNGSKPMKSWWQFWK